MSRKDWTLLVIAAAEGNRISPVQLQKALFLIGKALNLERQGDFYYFKPYNYGPFAAEIYSDAEALAIDGLVCVSKSSGESWPNYHVTLAGSRRANELRNQIGTEIANYTNEVVRWVRSLSFDQLLAYVYAQFPDYASKSIFRVRS